MDSLRFRLIVVTVCNVVLSLSCAVLFFTFLGIHVFFQKELFLKQFLLFIGIFFLLYLFLDSITTSIILRPIKFLSKELQKLLQEDRVEQLDLSRYPELKNLLLSTIKLIESAKKERDMAMMIKNTAESLSKTVLRDPLTSLYNREFLDRYLPDELSRSRILKRPLSLVMLDVDDFKHYNDNIGHPEGDQALKKVAQLIKNNTREYDVSVRYGGEEFCIIMPDTPLHQAEMICERIRSAVDAEVFQHQEKQPMKTLTASLGVASFPNHTGDKNLIIKYADTALYRAKRTGKNRVCVFDQMN